MENAPTTSPDFAAVAESSQAATFERLRKMMVASNGEYLKRADGTLYPNPDWHPNANALNRRKRLANLTSEQRRTYDETLARVSEFDSDVALVLAEVFANQVDKPVPLPVESVILSDHEKDQLRPFVPPAPKRRGPKPIDVFEILDELLQLSQARKSLGGGGKHSKLYARVTAAVERGAFQALLDGLPQIELSAPRRSRLRNLLEQYQTRFGHVERRS
jgi:hypothetical protein